MAAERRVTSHRLEQLRPSTPIATAQCVDHRSDRPAESPVILVEDNGGGPRGRSASQRFGGGSLQGITDSAALELLPSTNLDAAGLKCLQDPADDFDAAMTMYFDPRRRVRLLDRQNDFIRGRAASFGSESSDPDLARVDVSRGPCNGCGERAEEVTNNRPGLRALNGKRSDRSPCRAESARRPASPTRGGPMSRDGLDSETKTLQRHFRPELSVAINRGSEEGAVSARNPHDRGSLSIERPFERQSR